MVAEPGTLDVPRAEVRESRRSRPAPGVSIIRRLASFLALLAAIAVASGGGALRPATAEDVKDPSTAISFWAPDGWATLSETKPTFAVHRRVSPDGKTFCGCLASKVAGTVDDLLDAMEAYWHEGPETFVRLTKTDDTVCGALGTRVEYRVESVVKGMKGVARLGAQGDLRGAVWVVSADGGDAGAAALREKVLASLAFPGKPPPDAGARGGATRTGSGLMYDPKFREAGPFDVLVKGEEPLLRTHVDAFVDLVEAAYEVALTADEERGLRDSIETSFPAWDADARARFLHRMIERAVAHRALLSHDASAAKAALSAFASDVDGRIEAAPTAAFHQPLRQAKTRRASVFSPGEPPVTNSAEDAFEDLVHFLVCVARNEDRALTEGQRTTVRAETQRVLDASGPMMRRHYARMHRLWLFVKSRWDAEETPGKMRMRWAAIRAFKTITQSGAAPAAMNGDLAAYAKAAAEIAATLAPFDAYVAAFQQPQVVLTAALEGIGRDPSDLEGAFSLDTLTLR